MGKRKGGRPGRGVEGAGINAPDAGDVLAPLGNSTMIGAALGRFADALSITVVCQRSLAANESAAVGDEEVTLREAIRLLRLVYAELDNAFA